MHIQECKLRCCNFKLDCLTTVDRLSLYFLVYFFLSLALFHSQVNKFTSPYVTVYLLVLIPLITITFFLFSSQMCLSVVSFKKITHIMLYSLRELNERWKHTNIIDRSLRCRNTLKLYNFK